MSNDRHDSFSCLKGKYLRIFGAPLMKIIECASEISVPFIVRSIIDDGLSKDGSHYGEVWYILLLCSLVLVFAIIGFVFTILTQYIASKVSTDYGHDLRREVYAQFSALSSAEIDKFGRSKALNLLSSDAFALQNGLFMFMRIFVRSPVIVIGSIIASFVLNVYAGIAVLSALLLCALVVTIILAATPKKYGAVQTSLDKLTALSDDGVAGARVIRSFNKQADEVALFKAESFAYQRRSDQVARINSALNPLTFALINLAIVAVFYLGSFQFDFSGLSAGSIVAIMGLLTQSLASLISISRLVTSLSKASASKKRLDDFLSLQSQIQDGTKKLPAVKEGEPLLEAKQACLSYGGESLAVDHVDFLLNKGESIGVLGGTGSGKSTLISLLMRFADPNEGTLCYGGVPYKDLPYGEIRSQIAIVLQKAQLFKGTVKDNVTLGNPNCDEATLGSALRDSLAEEFVSRYPDGADHPIEEGGANLSGGQKQRLLIARALCSLRPILILDDSTSALDYKSDLMVRANIKKRKGVSLILVSQRATSIKDCDRIYVFDKGAVVGVGKHDDLLNDCPIYAETYAAQIQ